MARSVAVRSGSSAARIGTSFFATRAEGTGLGVVTVVRVVAQHGGRVHYASAPGCGNTVTLELPAQAPPKPAGAGALSTEPAAPVCRETRSHACALPAS